MKIKVKDLEPNPFRKMEQYPIDRAKVDALKTSIREKTFWDNILVRKKGDKYELAYGHHRWIALKELGIKEIDVPVRKIDDATMVQIMAEENLDWSTSPAVMTQTILTAKEFLDAELTKHTWVTLGQMYRGLFDGQRSFDTAKGMGTGHGTLEKFLGGNWTERKVRNTLNIITDKDLDQKAVCSIPTMEQATKFREAVKRHKIPKPTQKKIAKTIIKEGVGKRDIPDLVAEHSTLPVKKERVKPKPLPMLDDAVKDACSLMNTLYTKLGHIKGHIDKIQSRQLRQNFMRDGKELTELMLGVFKNGKEEKRTKRILSNSR